MNGPADDATWEELVSAVDNALGLTYTDERTPDGAE